MGDPSSSSSSSSLPLSDQPQPSTTPQTTTREWKLEESSLWWLSLDFFQHPGNILFLTSIPFCMGAYYGYAQPADRLEQWVGDDPHNNPHHSTSSQTTSRNNNTSTKKAAFATTSADAATTRALQRESEIFANRQMGVRLAARALGLATLGTIGTFGVLGAAGFYLAGYRTVEEAFSSTRQWASSRRESFEEWFGMEDRESKTHPDVVATKSMTEEEELNYVYDKLMKEVESNNKDASPSSR